MTVPWREVPYNRIGRWVLSAAFIVAVWQYAKIAGAEISEGVVIGHDAQDAYDGGTYYAPTISYPDGSGSWWNYSPRMATGWKTSKEGEKKRIYFYPTDQDRRGVLSFGYAFGFAWVLALAGSGFLALGWGFERGYEPRRLLSVMAAGAAALMYLGVIYGNLWVDRHFLTTIK